MVSIEEKYNDSTVEELKYLTKLTYHAKDYKKCRELFRLMVTRSKLKMERQDQYLLSSCLKTLILSENKSYDYMEKIYNKDKEISDKLKKEEQKNKDSKNETTKSKNEMKLNFLKDKLDNFVDDIKRNIDETNTLVDDFLKKVPYSQFEDKILYMKLKGDFLRYKTKYYKYKEDRDRCVNQCEKCYTEAIELAKKNKVNLNSPILLATQLNYAVFLYEVKYDKENSVSFLKGILSSVNNIQNDKECLNIIKTMKENVFIWGNDTSKREVVEYKEKGYDDDIYEF